MENEASLDLLLGRLLEHEVEFGVVGRYALVAHDISLPTMDIDVCIRLTVDNLMARQKALRTCIHVIE
mgnify:CR=1 FL=1